MGPLLTAAVLEQMRAAVRDRSGTVECSLDLSRSMSTVEVADSGWTWNGERYPYPDVCKERTIYHWCGTNFEPVARYSAQLTKLVPTDWGPPTFEIDGIKMLPTLRVSPYADAERKVGLIQPRGKVILDTCGGLGYFAAWCLQGRAAQILSYEKNPDVLWLRSLNPWSPAAEPRLVLALRDVALPAGAAGMPGIIVPRLACVEIGRLCAGVAEGGEVKVALSSAKLRVKASDVALSSRLIDGTFPE